MERAMWAPVLHLGIACLSLCRGMEIKEVPRPDGFITNSFSITSDTGSFVSHTDFPHTPYTAGQNVRFIIAAPQNRLIKLKFEVRNPSEFLIRPYDYAVAFDGIFATRMQDPPCSVPSYTAIGIKDLDYQSVVMADTKTIRTHTTITNIAVVDFCVHAFSSDTDRSSMRGFRATWEVVPLPAGGVTPSGVPCGRPFVSPSHQMQSTTTRIVGGVEAAEKSWPWACALVSIISGKQFCDCSIVDRQWVITAGHCMWDSAEFMVNNVKVLYGSQHLPTASSVSIAKFIRHPQYISTNWTNDVALAKLSVPFPAFSDTVQPVCLPIRPVSDTPAAFTGSNGNRPVAFVGGWGLMQENAQSYKDTQIGSGSDRLMMTSIEMFSWDECRSVYPGIFSAKSMCGGNTQGGHDSCQGDSGGPVILQPLSDQPFLQIGIVSYGRGCARKDYPAAYTDVFTLSSWIRKTIATT